MTGLDREYAANFGMFAGQRVGLLTHPAALTTQSIIHDARTLFARQTNLVTLFGPEHGLTGEAQDLIPIAAGERIISLYGETFASLKPTPDQLAGIDVLAIDLQDVGSRYYTFQATMLYCLEACAAVGLPVVILDRPNPLGRAVEGPSLKPGYESFVGPHDIATRHGMTMGELARFYIAERNIDSNLTIIPCNPYATTDFVLPPSPNMPSVRTATVYPGMCLIEGTNLSEGRGTTRPFECVGHPDLDPNAAADALNSAGLPGVRFLPTRFTPTFQKHANRSCGGLFIVPTGDEFRPVRTGLAILTHLKKQLGDRFVWRTETYEFVSNRPAIDILFGSDRERTLIDSGTDWRVIAQQWDAEERLFAERREPYLISTPS